MYLFYYKKQEFLALKIHFDFRGTTPIPSPFLPRDAQFSREATFTSPLHCFKGARLPQPPLLQDRTT